MADTELSNITVRGGLVDVVVDVEMVGGGAATRRAPVRAGRVPCGGADGAGSRSSNGSGDPDTPAGVTVVDGAHAMSIT